MTGHHIQPVLEALDALSRAATPDEAAFAALAAAVNTVDADAAQLTRLGSREVAVWSCAPGVLDRAQTVVVDSGRVLRISDLRSAHEYRSTPTCAELFQSASARNQVAFSIPTGADHVLCMTLQRDGVDFTDDDCRALNALRPCLQLTARRHPAAPAESAVVPQTGQLTFREYDVLRLAATGMSDRQIARCLCISAYTVSKHLQHIYRKTGASNRTHAAALLDQLAAAPGAASDAFADHDLAAGIP